MIKVTFNFARWKDRTSGTLPPTFFAEPKDDEVARHDGFAIRTNALRSLGNDIASMNWMLKLENSARRVTLGDFDIIENTGDTTAAPVASKDNSLPNFLNWEKLEPARIYSNEVAKVTVVVFKDGGRSVVRCSKGTEYDLETAVAYAVCERLFGSHSQFKRRVLKNVVERKEKEAK